MANYILAAENTLVRLGHSFTDRLLTIRLPGLSLFPSQMEALRRQIQVAPTAT
jgi:hypothetical protein